MSAEPLNTQPTTAKPRRSWLWLLAAAIILAGGVYLIYNAKPQASTQANAGGGKRGGPGQGNKPMPVQAKPARSGDLNVYLNGLGTVTPSSTVTVHSRVDGPLLALHFQEGQVVKAGALLAEIDPATFRIQLAQAQGQLAKDQALLANAKQDLARYQTLLAQDSISKQQVDTQAALVRQTEGTVQADQATVDAARLQLSYTRIVAPVSGRLGLRQVDPGNLIHASDTNGLVLINEVTPIAVLFTIPQDKLPPVLKQLNDGQTLAIDAYDRAQTTKLASGKLLTVDNQIDTTTGTVKLKAVFPNEDGTLFPNQFVNVRLLVETLHNATILPTAAVQRGAQGTFVFVVGADTSVSAQPVTLGPVDGDNVVIQSGVKPGDVVVIDGADKLKEGGKVEVVAANASGVAGKRPHGGKGGANASGAQHRHKNGSDGSGAGSDKGANS
ncbi:MdtA/MuxA family multidrug efflux RND transporter periplasmic adaptor subunit [Andreprevotia chitinilytica]|uniref:MdtA/MuxA family multidrug efflux RND transporter periplasmic adaptor subunit n=1 Tax=Andreprevotia chitinilytica TaxID=396808 RepID=UPI0009FE92FE|nr:MdtA/MuxA family multidrug efflux RND transporter periplasmic adaptor subunit [Andreprevotia chitinilytica]